jgi:pre-mRNA-splicing factor ISY1
LTDYEIRDINDQINKLLREKHHWENQIIALGGANYKRAAGKSTDADGREVPGQRGYKCVALSLLPFFPCARRARGSSLTQ